MRPTILRRFGWLWLGVSTFLYLLTLLAYSLQPDHLAAMSALPIWMWGGVGVALSLIAWRCLKTRKPILLTGLWVITAILSADEIRVVKNIGNESPKPGSVEPYEDDQPIRVITLNAAQFRFGDPSEDIAAWKPDIVILQETPGHLGNQLKRELYGDKGSISTNYLNTIITRWKITKQTRNPDRDFNYTHHNVTIELPNQQTIDVVNLHLTSAATNMRLWSPNCWKEHKHNRYNRKVEMEGVLQFLRGNTSLANGGPMIIAGDFNAPASDPVRDLIDDEFTDAFRKAGKGWGNTFHRRVPILRLDQIHVTAQFTPVRCRAVTTRNSDHRFVVADLLFY